MTKMFDLTGRLALVTGSSRGIGRAIAEGYVAAGARVLINGRDAAAVDAAVKAIGKSAIAAPFDVTDKANCRERGREDREGRRADRHPGEQRRHDQAHAVHRISRKHDWRQIMATNLNSVFFVTQAVARRMIERAARQDRQYLLGDVRSSARPTIAPYTASKGAVKMLTKAMCAEFAKHGITANGISPGYFGTELNTALMNDEKFSAWVCARTPAGRWGKVEELQGAAIFLASDASSFVNGHILFVDGGMTAVV